MGEPNGKYSVRGVYVDARDSGVQLLRCLGLRPESFLSFFSPKSARVSVSSLGSRQGLSRRHYFASVSGGAVYVCVQFNASEFFSAMFSFLDVEPKKNSSHAK